MKHSDHDNFQRCLKALLWHLEELRPILNARDLDDRAINAARKLVRKFVLSQTSIEANGTIYLCQRIAKSGEPDLGTCDADYGALGPQFRDGRLNELVAAQGFDFICDLLFLLLDFTRRESMARERRERAQELCDRASDFVELLTGKSWTTKVISLEVNAATCIASLGKDQFDIGSQQAARWLKVLADRPGEWFSGRELELHDTELLDVRTDKLKKELPKKIARLIESKPGCGSRLRLDWFGGRS